MNHVWRLLLAPIHLVFEGWVIVLLWRWFVIPLGAPAVNVPTAIGLAALISLLTKQIHRSPDHRSERDKWVDFIAAAFIFPTGALVTGAIARLFL